MFRVIFVYPEPSGGVYASSMDFSDAVDAASVIVDQLDKVVSCTVTRL